MSRKLPKIVHVRTKPSPKQVIAPAQHMSPIDLRVPDVQERSRSTFKNSPRSSCTFSFVLLMRVVLTKGRSALYPHFIMSRNGSACTRQAAHHPHARLFRRQGYTAARGRRWSLERTKRGLKLESARLTLPISSTSPAWVVRLSGGKTVCRPVQDTAIKFQPRTRLSSFSPKGHKFAAGAVNRVTTYYLARITRD